MTLKEANKKLEELENDYEYYLNEKEELLSLVLPKATNITLERVDGGTREDKMMKYIETDEEKRINDTLEYIDKKKQNLIRWINEELRILNKYGELETLIIQLKENTSVKDKYSNKYRELTWEEIGKKTGYNKDHCRKIYRLYKKKRNL